MSGSPVKQAMPPAKHEAKPSGHTLQPVPIQDPNAILSQSPNPVKVACPCEGNCPRCAPAAPNHSPGPSAVRGLSTSQKNDTLEQEADQLSEMLVASTGLESGLPVDPDQNSSRHAAKSPEAASLHGLPGSPLPVSWQQTLRQAFNLNADNVRLHADPQADDMCQELQARAFTHRNHIYLNRWARDLDKAANDKLLAHELVHVQQQARLSITPDLQLDHEPERPMFRPTAESAIILYRSHEGPLREGETQEYTLSLHHLDIPESELTYLWLVYDEEIVAPIYRQETTLPAVSITASRAGNFRLAVVIMRNGELFTSAHDGIVVQLNETVLPTREAEAAETARLAGRTLARHDMPPCDGETVNVDQVQTYDLGAIDSPAANCSFSPLYFIPGRSLTITAHVDNPPGAGGSWSMTTFECPVGFSNEQACERGFGVSTLVSGDVSQDLVFHYDPFAWTSRKVFLRFRNGSTEQLSNVRVTLDPDIRDPLLQTIHDALGLAGLLPVVGIVADGLDVLLYVADGDWGDAAVSAVAMVPAFGDSATVTRLGSRDIIRVLRSEVSTDSATLAARLQARLRMIREGAVRVPDHPERVIAVADLAAEQRRIEALARDVANFHAVTDPDLIERGYQIELRLEGDVVYRRRAGGIWCRFSSPPDCGLWVGDEVERRAMEAIAGSEGPGGISITTDPSRIEHEPVTRTRPEGSRAHPDAHPLVRAARGLEAARGTLRRRLERLDEGFPGYRWEAHHIIPWEFRDHPVIQFLRDRPRGWDHNDPFNGIALPMEEGVPGAGNLPLHQVADGVRFHEAYSWRVYSRLQEIYDRWDNVATPVERRISDEQVRTVVEGLIQELRDDFYSGRLRVLM